MYGQQINGATVNGSRLGHVAAKIPRNRITHITRAMLRTCDINRKTTKQVKSMWWNGIERELCSVCTLLTVSGLHGKIGAVNFSQFHTNDDNLNVGMKMKRTEIYESN